MAQSSRAEAIVEFCICIRKVEVLCATPISVEAAMTKDLISWSFDCVFKEVRGDVEVGCSFYTNIGYAINCIRN